MDKVFGASAEEVEDLKYENTHLCLNEVFCGEKDVGSASRYRLCVEGNEWGVFKSSGLVIATGTGSTGWLYSSKIFTKSKLRDIQMMMGTLEISEEVNETIAEEISDQTKFPIDEDKMYFYVREGFSLNREGEGFCTHLKVTSEMLNGEIIIDGHIRVDLSIGDVFCISTGP